MVKSRSSNPRIEEPGEKSSLSKNNCSNNKNSGKSQAQKVFRNLLIYVSAEPENNEANLEVISMLSKHFGVSWKNIKIKSGLTSKNKLIEIC